ncbi:hypothetical protein H5410_015254 [Solanum commersonii]|uniref:Uncharacterized protein n=1 Tax=Solanum commersonii TaxID=4109 RepID=A0A9J5ZT67_SOLCO|nr:hypothetical protein H5410_015254 [Solanum commersonii]
MIPMRRIPTLPQEPIVEIFLWLPVMSCVLDFTHVHHLLSMIRDGGTRFLMGKDEDLYVVDLNEDGNTSRWNFDHRDKYFNGPCVNEVQSLDACSKFKWACTKLYLLLKHRQIMKKN